MGEAKDNHTPVMSHTHTHTHTHLANADDGTEDDSSKTDTQDPVNEVPSEDREDHVGPGVEGVE